MPEDVVRQKIKVTHLGGATDLDIFISYYAQEGAQFLSFGLVHGHRADDERPYADQP